MNEYLTKMTSKRHPTNEGPKVPQQEDAITFNVALRPQETKEKQRLAAKKEQREQMLDNDEAL